MRFPFLADWSRFQVIIAIVMLTVTIAFIVFICSFKVMDRDFWWHITAGRVMTSTHSLIYTEPFSYTRAGQPYLARYEWLSQVTLYFVHQLGGINGVILFRTLLVTLTWLFILLIDPKQLWLNSVLVIVAANLGRSSYMDRPQLFTFVLLSVFLWLALRVLEQDTTGQLNWKTRWRLLIWFPLLQVLWVNFHGAAALVGLVVVTAVVLQMAWNRYIRECSWIRVFRNLRTIVLGLGGGMLLATFISPNTYHNLTYLFSLFSDRTIDFIAEWQPRQKSVYIREFGPLWLLSVPLLLLRRRHWVFSSLILLGTGYLSLTAFRHEILFTITATAVIISQLRGSSWYDALSDRLLRRPLPTFLGLMVIVCLLGFYTLTRYHNFALKDHLHGFGVDDLARGAYDFIEREAVTGNMFNTYGIGGYLMYRGYPQRLVYLDGRNVDYGYAFLQDTFKAGFDAAAWQKLEDRYQLTYALIDYDAINELDKLPYSAHLDSNPEWSLVFMDDRVAVYLKKLPQYQNIIEQRSYSLVRPEALHRGQVISSAREEQLPDIEKELRRIIEGNPQGVKARLELAKLYLQSHRQNEASALLNEAVALQPYRAELWATRAAVAVQEERWEAAAHFYERAILLAGNVFPDINFTYVADIFAKAGRPYKANFYRWKASSTPFSTPTVFPSPTGQDEQAEKLQQELEELSGEEAKKLNDEGVALIEADKHLEAQQKFLEALKINPHYAEALNNMGSLFLEEGDFTQAISYYHKAVAINPDFGDARYNLALALYKAKRYDEARQQVAEARRLGKDTRQLEMLLQKL